MEQKNDFNPIHIVNVIFIAAADLLLCAAIRFFGGNASDGIVFTGLGGLLLMAGGVMLHKIKSK